MPASARGRARQWNELQFGPSEGVRSVMERPKPRRGEARVGVGVDRGRLEKRHAKKRGTARAPGAEAQAVARQAMQRSGERGEESARLSCPLHTEAVPSKGFALNFSEPKHGLEERRSSPWFVAGSSNDKLSYRSETRAKLLRHSCKFSCKTGEKLASLQQNCV